MEEIGGHKRKKKYYQADFLTRPVLLYAALLFTLYQVMKLIRLFSDAIAFNREHGIVPEEFTMGAVTGAILLIALTGLICLMLLRQKKGISHIRRGNRFLILDLLLAVYGLVRLISQCALFLQNFEILFLLDVLAIGGGLIAPALMLWLADRQRIPPGDVLLLIIGAGAIGFSALGFIMVAISIGKDYTVLHAVPELAFRAGVLLMGLAALRTALKLRAELPIDMPLPKPEQEKKPKKERELHLKLFDRLPGFDDEEDEGGISLFDGDTDEPAAPVEAAAPAVRAVTRERPAERPAQSADGRLSCPDCGKRFPAYLGVCPRCGRDVYADDADEPAAPVEAAAPAARAVMRERPAERPAQSADGRLSC
ncbi:MAG: hypothetical protein Q4C13_04815, partial [Clostridia bacterium]|nr:hypothetical protein [Clostridia bacterium]